MSALRALHRGRLAEPTPCGSLWVEVAGVLCALRCSGALWLEGERARKAGASTVLMKVCPVLPSLPATGTPRSSARRVRAGMSAARLGVKLP